MGCGRMESLGPMKVFVSASAADAATRDELIKHLKPLSVELCHAAALATADVALVLVSASYLADGLLQAELARILDERARRGLRVLPV